MKPVSEAFANGRTIKSFPRHLTLAEAYRMQEELVDLLEPRWGARCGYKVGLTGKITQELFGMNGPARGILCREMLLPDGAVVPAAFGARPHFEGDLLVTVADEQINEARTVLEVAGHLRNLMPLIELPDLLFEEGEPINGASMAAINMGARLGVLGQPVLVEATEEFVRAVGKMTVVTSDETGQEYGRAPGTSLLGHPFQVVIWLAEELKRQGKRLRTGDVISLGSFSQPQPPRAGQTVSVVYTGLPGGPMRVSVKFH